MKYHIKSTVYLLLILSPLLTACTSTERVDNLSHFPEGFGPKEVGDRIARRFIDLNQHVLYRGKYINYQEACLWIGVSRYAERTHNDELRAQLVGRFEPFYSTEQHLVPPPIHVDLTVFGSIPLEMYRTTNDSRYFDMGISYADAQWTLPAEHTDEEQTWADKDYSWQTRLWIDDMYMITLLQSQAYKTTGDRRYIDRAAREMVLYLDELQRSNGLFYHAPDVPFFWGRGNGWMAVGMAELLSVLPDDNPDRKRIMQGYRTMMESLKTYQTPEGMWNQLVDDPECWAETSCSGMFAYAMIVGVKSGWLPEPEYADCARKAWLALITYINEDDDITEVCVGTNKENSREYYYKRKRRAGDYHGQASIMWCAYALLNDYNNEEGK